MTDKNSLTGRLRALPWTSLLAVAIPMLSAGLQLAVTLAGEDAPVWLGPLESLGVTLLALLVGLWLLARSVRDTRARADRFHVGEALAVGYGLNFLQPTGHRLEPDRPAGQLLVLSDAGDGAAPPQPVRVQRLLVALPLVVDGLDNASIVGLRRQLQQALGEGWWVGSARLNHADADPVPAGPDTLAGKPAGLATGSAGPGTGRGVGVTAVVQRDSGATVLIDLPSTLTVVPHFAQFVAGQELEGSPWAHELVAAGRSATVRRYEAAKFAQVLRDALDGAAPASSGEPSAEDLLRRRLGALRGRIALVSLASPADVAPLVQAVRRAVQAMA